MGFSTYTETCTHKPDAIHLRHTFGEACLIEIEFINQELPCPEYYVKSAYDLQQTGRRVHAYGPTRLNLLASSRYFSIRGFGEFSHDRPTCATAVVIDRSRTLSAIQDGQLPVKRLGSGNSRAGSDVQTPHEGRLTRISRSARSQL